MTPTLVWFRQDLRLQDNPALNAALARGGAIVPVYVLEADPPFYPAKAAGDESPSSLGRTSTDAFADWPTAAPGDARGNRRPVSSQIGAASRWWLHHSLLALDASLRERGSRLVVARGDAPNVLEEIAGRTGAGAVYWNRRYEPDAAVRDARSERALAAAGREVRTFNSSLLNEPPAIANKAGGPFQVFTAYWRHCLTVPVSAPMKLPAGALPAPARWPASLTVDALDLLPRIRWDEGLAETWSPGEANAARRLARFVAGALDRYEDERDLPGCDGTSMLSPSLHHGELSPRQIWAAVKARSKASGVFPPSKGAAVFLREIGWREFAYHVLHHFPQTPTQPRRAEFARFPWATDPGGAKARAWRQGQTGYPIVDAGMRQLWRTGWMHNRVRMISASFLVKHLRLPWTLGAAWFEDTLVDADLASNSLGWQWSAGCGADAAPYFRVFAPVPQGRKFDRDGMYVRRWIPELARLPDEHLHAPWTAPAAVLDAAGVRLGIDYPAPIVDHATARAEALEAFRQMRRSMP